MKRQMKKIHSIYIPVLAVLITVVLSLILFNRSSQVVQPRRTVLATATRQDTSAKTSTGAKLGATESVDSASSMTRMVQGPLLPAMPKPLRQSSLEPVGKVGTSSASEAKPVSRKKREAQRHSSQPDAQTTLIPTEPVKKVLSDVATNLLQPAPVQKADSSKPLVAEQSTKPAATAITDTILSGMAKSQRDNLKFLPTDSARKSHPLESWQETATQPGGETMIAAQETEQPAIPVASTANPKSAIITVEKMQATKMDHEDVASVSMRTADPIHLVEEVSVDQDQVYEDILNLVKSKISVLHHQEADSGEIGKEVLLAANLPKKESVMPIKTKRLGRHGIGIGYAAIKPMIGTRVTTPGSAEISYSYSAASRLQWQLAAGVAPLSWPGGKKTSMISGDLVSHYLLQPGAKFQPMISIGLGLIRAKLDSDKSINTSSLVAGPGIGIRISDRTVFTLQLQYKQPMTNLIRTNSLKRDAFISLKAELKFFPHKSTPVHQLTEENLVAEKD